MQRSSTSEGRIGIHQGEIIMGKRKLREIKEKYGSNEKNLNNTEDVLKEQNKKNRYYKNMINMFPPELMKPLQKYLSRKVGIKPLEEDISKEDKNHKV
jgi:hypothetical protein